MGPLSTETSTVQWEHQSGGGPSDLGLHLTRGPAGEPGTAVQSSACQTPRLRANPPRARREKWMAVPMKQSFLPHF